jgi:hypothetical protein
MDEDLSYPLHWPPGRTRATHRQPAAFRTDGGRRILSVDDALKRLMPELRRLGARDVIVSTNVRPRRVGELVGADKVADPAVAVYFHLPNGKGPAQQHCIACDRWTRLADNLAAVAAHVEAVRGTMRWGCGDVLQAFAGYKALPAMGAKRAWWEIMGIDRNAPAAQIKARFRELAERHHPDRGGNPNQMAEISAAYEEAQAARLPAAAAENR